MKPFYITTPIYYVNDKPHIGHAYSTIAADVVRRFAALCGRPSRMLTGTDEHGQKVERKAQELGKDPQAFVDGMAPAFGEAFTALGCEFDDFIRTTQARHKTQVNALWKRLEEAGDLYLGEYEGWYSVSEETYFTEKELLPGNLDPIGKRPVERVSEQSYFFRLSNYTERLLEFYEQNPTFVQPSARFNEVKSFVKGGLRDLSVSRTGFQWGVPVPKDSSHVMYVWLDALTNYMSALGGPAPQDESQRELFDTFWAPKADVVHIVGKDILRFHAVYWPAFLMSAGLALPSQIWAHGWLTVDGEKMSKSTGNFIPPAPIAEAFGRDTLRYYLMREIAFGQDGDFSHQNLLARYRGDLGNGVGNLLHRTLAIVARNLGGNLPKLDPATFSDLERELLATSEQTCEQARKHLDSVTPHRALEVIWELVGAANRYVDQTAPWALAKENRTEDLARVLGTVGAVLSDISLMLWPFMPDKGNALREQLGLPAIAPEAGNDQWPDGKGVGRGTSASQTVRPGEPLFPRIDEKREAELFASLGIGAAKPSAPPSGDGKKSGKAVGGKKSAAPQKSTAGPKGADGGHIAFDDFTKVELKLGKVISAEAVEKSDKLLRLRVDLGEAAPRQIVAGIRKHYDPEALVGRAVAVVANLAPRKIFGLQSEGMLLAASDDDGLCLLGVDKAVSTGSTIG